MDNSLLDRPRIICLDHHRELISHESAENPEGRMSVSQLAYVIYTSGSTGKTKGVEITQSNFVSLHLGFGRCFKCNARRPISPHSVICLFLFCPAICRAACRWGNRRGGLVRPDSISCVAVPICRSTRCIDYGYRPVLLANLYPRITGCGTR